MICFCCNYHGFCVLYPCYDIYVYVYMYCCDGFCSERRYYVSFCFLWTAVAIAPTNCLKFIWWVQAYMCCCYLTYCGVYMNVCDLIWECDVLWDYFGGGDNPSWNDPHPTFVTSAALNGLNVTMGYCVTFCFKVQSPDFLFFLSSSSANLKTSCRFEILQDLNLFLIYGFMVPSIKFEVRIVLAGS